MAKKCVKYVDGFALPIQKKKLRHIAALRRMQAGYGTGIPGMLRG
jgi:hypothetical protein